MDQSGSPSEEIKCKYDDRMGEIRTLLEDLEQELTPLCHQCTAMKTEESEINSTNNQCACTQKNVTKNKKLDLKPKEDNTKYLKRNSINHALKARLVAGSDSKKTPLKKHTLKHTVTKNKLNSEIIQKSDKPAKPVYEYKYFNNSNDTHHLALKQKPHSSKSSMNSLMTKAPSVLKQDAPTFLEYDYNNATSIDNEEPCTSKQAQHASLLNDALNVSKKISTASRLSKCNDNTKNKISTKLQPSKDKLDRNRTYLFTPHLRSRVKTAQHKYTDSYRNKRSDLLFKRLPDTPTNEPIKYLLPLFPLSDRKSATNTESSKRKPRIREETVNKPSSNKESIEKKFKDIARKVAGQRNTSKTVDNNKFAAISKSKLSIIINTTSDKSLDSTSSVKILKNDVLNKKQVESSQSQVNTKKKQTSYAKKSFRTSRYITREPSIMKIEATPLFVRSDSKKIHNVIETDNSSQTKLNELVRKYFAKHTTTSRGLHTRKLPKKKVSESSFDSQHGRIVENIDSYGSDSSLRMTQSTSNTSVLSSYGLLGMYTEANCKIQLSTIFSNYKEKVMAAVEKKCIFKVYGHFKTIRKELRSRGWLEKLPSKRYAITQELPESVLLLNARDGNEYEAVLVSRILEDYPENFVWQTKIVPLIDIKDAGDQSEDYHFPYRSRVRRSCGMDFTTKLGLISCAKEDPMLKLRYPRCYRLDDIYSEKAAFVEDFRQSQCRAFMNYLCNNLETCDLVIDDKSGTVPVSIALFALERVHKQYVELDADRAGEICEEVPIKDQEWKNFLMFSSEIIHKKSRLRISFNKLTNITNEARPYLRAIEQNNRNMKWDGCRNIWLLKPGCRSRGLGIVISRDMEHLLRTMYFNNKQRYVVQKYIERPLLIYNTKFDIRMYLMYTIGAQIISVWLYDNCYLRFSSQVFTLTDLRESVHLTNNFVQKKYMNSKQRDKRLPACNMWTLQQFLVYLESQHKYDVWKSHILPAVRKNLVAVISASLKETELVKNTFELFGCDFMLDEEYNPILIEINSSPDLSNSTPVTAELCPMVLKDMVRVVVDYPNDKDKYSGLFRLIHRYRYE